MLAGHSMALARIRASRQVLTGFSCSAMTSRAEPASLSVEAISRRASIPRRLNSLRNVSMSRFVTVCSGP